MSLAQLMLTLGIAYDNALSINGALEWYVISAILIAVPGEGGYELFQLTGARTRPVWTQCAFPTSCNLLWHVLPARVAHLPRVQGEGGGGPQLPYLVEGGGARCAGGRL